MHPMPSRPSLLSESLFGEALARSDIAAFLIRGDAIIAANEAASRLTGYGTDELLTLTTAELAGPRDAAEEAERMRRREAAERGVWQSGPGKVLRKDGAIRAVHVVGGATDVGSTPTFLALAWEPEAFGGEALPGGVVATARGAPGEPDPVRTRPAERPAPGKGSDDRARDRRRARRGFAPVLR